MPFSTVARIPLHIFELDLETKHADITVTNSGLMVETVSDADDNAPLKGCDYLCQY